MKSKEFFDLIDKLAMENCFEDEFLVVCDDGTTITSTHIWNKKKPKSKRIKRYIKRIMKDFKMD